MRVFVDRKEFEEVLKKAKIAAEKRANMPILNNLKLSAEEDKLSIYTTNLESFLVMELPARVEETGTVCVNANKLTSIVEELPSLEVHMKLAEDKLIIRGGKSQFKLVCADPSEFPEFPDVQCKDAIPSNLLLKGISKVGYAISKEDTKYALQGMYVANKEGKLHFVGSLKPVSDLVVLYRQTSNFFPLTTERGVLDLFLSQVGKDKKPPKK